MVFCLSACSTPPYEQRESGEAIAAENIARYGSIAGGGAGGYFIGQHIGGNTASGVAGAVGGTGLMYALNKGLDALRGSSYKNGKLDGAAEARAELLNNMWQKEAVMGVKDSDNKEDRNITRRVYVPERVIDGVKYAGGYQSVQVAYP